MRKRVEKESRSTTRATHERKKGSQLLKTLTGNAGLPAFIRTLETPVLQRLIEHVGLRDAGDLIALTTSDQLRGIFEVSLWETLIPGEAERPRPERFVEWLDVMLDIGSAFTAQKLIELGESFVALNLAPLITVIDRSVAAEHIEGTCFCVLCALHRRDAPYEVVGEYIVVGVHADEWDLVKAVLVELEGEDATFLDRVLGHCSTAPTMSDLTGDAHADALLREATYEREQRRASGGFVTPPIAAMFLAQARRAPLDELASQKTYDEISRRYFEQLALGGTTGRTGDAASEESSGDEDEPPSATPLQIHKLQDALIDAEIVADNTPLLLEGPTARGATLELQARIERLRFDRPDVFGARLGELVYLANVLMVGSWYQGGRFSETDAAQAALACANLGLDFLSNADASTVDDWLGDAPGIVGLFQMGWRLIQALPMRCATALLDMLRSDDVRDQLRRRAWILDEIESAVSDPDLLQQIEQRAFEDVGDNLMLLSLVLDARACRSLRTLIVDFPRYPTQLDAGFHPAQPPVDAYRFFTRVVELDRVDTFVGELDRLLKV